MPGFKDLTCLACRSCNRLLWSSSSKKEKRSRLMNLIPYDLSLEVMNR
jgi:hypothetical protein